MGFWNLDPPNCSTHYKKATAAENLLTNSTVEEDGKKKERVKERAEKLGGRRRERVKGGWKREFIGRNGRREEKEGGKQGNKERGRLYLYYVTGSVC